MNAQELRELTDAQLHTRLEESRQELFNLRFQIATRKIKNHQRIPQVKKNISRILTVIRERDLMVAYGGGDVEPLPHPEEEAPAAAPAPRRRGLLGRNQQEERINSDG